MRINLPQRGISLIELIIFIVIVSVGIAGILSVMNITTRSSADPLVRKQAAAIVDSIMAEVLLKAYTDPDGIGGETGRSDYDDVDDYNGKSNALFTDLPAALSGYVITIQVAAPAALSGVNMKKITVSASRGTESVSMVAYRADY